VKLPHSHNDYLKAILAGNTITCGSRIRLAPPIGDKGTIAQRLFSLPIRALFPTDFPTEAACTFQKMLTSRNPTAKITATYSGKSDKLKPQSRSGFLSFPTEERHQVLKSRAPLRVSGRH
jgi:hypothetical protein